LASAVSDVDLIQNPGLYYTCTYELYICHQIHLERKPSSISIAWLICFLVLTRRCRSIANEMSLILLKTGE
jgi:hypothetical protein